MADPEQPVDLGVRSDALEQVRCTRNGLVTCFTELFHGTDIQKG